MSKMRDKFRKRSQMSYPQFSQCLRTKNRPFFRNNARFGGDANYDFEPKRPATGWSEARMSFRIRPQWRDIHAPVNELEAATATHFSRRHFRKEPGKDAGGVNMATEQQLLDLVHEYARRISGLRALREYRHRIKELRTDKTVWNNWARNDGVYHFLDPVSSDVAFIGKASPGALGNRVSDQFRPRGPSVVRRNCEARRDHGRNRGI